MKTNTSEPTDTRSARIHRGDVFWLEPDDSRGPVPSYAHPHKVAALAKAELGVPEGEVPEDSDEDLFVHVRCDVCGKEKLIVQSPDV